MPSFLRSAPHLGHFLSGKSNPHLNFTTSTLKSENLQLGQT